MSICVSFRQLEAMVMGEGADSKYSSPVIVMPGVSHAQFATGAMPPAVTKADLTPEVSGNAARALIAKHTSDFLIATLGQEVVMDPQAYSKALFNLDQAYDETKAIMNVSI